MAEFWAHSGWHLLKVNANGDLEVTADFIRAYFNRPEVAPEADSGAGELALHASLVAEPLRAVPDHELAAVEDDDARYNYQVLLNFRDFLINAGTLEAAYLRLVRGEAAPQMPMLFVDQMVHAILRQVLSGTDDALQARAAEVFFREQTVSTDDGRIMLADEDTVEMVSQTGGLGGLGQLLAEADTPAKRVELDVLHEDNKEQYWARSDRFDTVIDFRFTQPALDAFVRVMEQWIAHFLKIDVRIEPVQRIDDDDWRWHIGLDAEATRILNGLYQGQDAEFDDQARIVALFTMDIKDRGIVMEAIRGRPVYLGLAIDAERRLRMKPQNLLVNMPVESSA